MKYLTQVVYTYTICEIKFTPAIRLIVLTHFNLEVLGCHAAAISTRCELWLCSWL